MTTTLDPFNPDTWSEEEKAYFEKVDTALAQGADLLFSNGRPQHAVYLIEKFFTHAKKEVRLFSGRLSRTVRGVEVYGNHRIAAAVENLLTANVKLQVVLQDDIDVDAGQTWVDHPLARIEARLKQAGKLSGSLDIRQSSPDSIRHLEEFSFLNHWMVMDRTAYRLETNVRRAAAHVNFGDGKMANMLADIFDDVLFKSAKQLT